MPYDPSLPLNNAQVQAALLRAQFNGLKDLIDALPAINAAQVDGVNTVNPGDPATVNLSIIGSTLHFSFALPRGNDGGQGPPGAPFTNFIMDAVTTLDPGDPATASASFDGTAVRLALGIPQGVTGAQGIQGPPFTTFLIDGVTTLNPGQPATVATSFDGTAVRFTFGLPRGDAGPPGPPFANVIVEGVTTLDPGENATVSVTLDGSNVRFQFGIPRGDPGGSGSQGPPGEVTNAQLATAINGTSSNSNAVDVLGLTMSDPPTQSEMQAMADKLDELITALRR